MHKFNKKSSENIILGALSYHFHQASRFFIIYCLLFNFEALAVQLKSGC